jgi:hypothetical protein
MSKPTGTSGSRDARPWASSMYSRIQRQVTCLSHRTRHKNPAPGCPRGGELGRKWPTGSQPAQPLNDRRLNLGQCLSWDDSAIASYRAYSMARRQGPVGSAKVHTLTKRGGFRYESNAGVIRLAKNPQSCTFVT